MSTVMAVRLLGDPDDFGITPLSSAVQTVGDVHTNGAEWAWDVTPRKTGERRLTLVAAASFGEVSRDVILYDDR